MTPLGSGPAGYADFQRVSSYDTGSLLYQLSGVQGNLVASPVLDVSRFLNIGGELGLGGAADVLVEVTWYIDAAGTITVGGTEFWITPNIANPMCISLRNLGPYVSFIFNAQPATHFTAQPIKIFGTNRQNQILSLPIGPLLIDQQNVAIAATTSQPNYPNSYWAGPATLAIFPTAAAATWQLAVETATGTFAAAGGGAGNLTASTWTTSTVQLPFGVWRIDFITGANAMNYYMALIPALTGSS